MRIGIDVRHLSRGPFTGVAEVTQHLIEGLAASPGHEIRIFYSGRKAPPVLLKTWQERYPKLAIKELRIPNRLLDLPIQAIGLPKIDALLGGVDVFFSPHALLTPLSSPRVLVLHDLSFVVHPDFFSPQSRLWHAMMRMRGQARRAAKIIVPSRATARDLERYWNISQKKIVIIPWAAPTVVGASLALDTRAGRNEKRGSRTIVFVGTVEKRKNVVGLLRAFTFLKRDMQFRDVRLVIAGASGWGSHEAQQEARASSSASDIFFRGYVTDEEREVFLRDATIFVYPSYYEGFGLPILEAMAHGVPVITSRTTSLPEVAGDAAVLINPREPQEIAEAMRLLLSDIALAAEYSQRSLERAKNFSWEKTTQQVLAVLHEAAKSR